MPRQEGPPIPFPETPLAGLDSVSQTLDASYASPASKEQLWTPSILTEHIDVNSERQMRKITRILKHEENREHIVGIRQDSSIFDIRDHYLQEDTKGYGFVGFNENRDLIGVYNFRGAPRAGGSLPYAEATFVFTEWVCVAPEFQGRGYGPLLIEDAERRGLEEYKWTSLFAGIILDESETEMFRKIESYKDEDPSLERDFNSFLRSNNKKVHVFSNKRKWRIVGTAMQHVKMLGETSERAVTLVQKTADMRKNELRGNLPIAA